MDRANVARALGAGAVGAGAVTAVHQVARAVTEDAPRMDRYARRALARGMEMANVEPPHLRNLQRMALATDLISNTLFYALVGLGTDRHAWRRGLLLGAAAGIGGVVLPPLIGLGARPSNRTHKTQAMTVAWYLLGGLAAAGTLRLMGRSDRRWR